MSLYSPNQEPERRVVTVMFADISGFTAMSEQMDPEEVSSIMNRCFSMMENIIEKYGGTIDKFMGDCVMALFGVPAAIENAAYKAIQTALEIQNRLNLLNRENRFGAQLDIHVGINTGTVLAGAMGGDRKKEFTVMGDTVNIASRLESISQVGQILVGQDTYHAVRGRFQFKKLKPLILKGKSEIMSIYELLPGKRSVYHNELTSHRMIFSELIGRDTEVAMITSCFQKLSEGSGGIISITGEAGIGKSRILYEVRKMKVCRKFIFLEGKSISMGNKFGFHSFSNLFQNWAGIKENDPEEVSFRKLEKATRSLLDKEADEVLPFVATIMGLSIPDHCYQRTEEIEGDALEILIVKSIKKLLVKLSSKRPVVLIMEDFHWSDTSSIELLSELLPLCQKYSILFVNLFRPITETNMNRMVGNTKIQYPDRYIEMHIQPLSESQGECLIDSLIKTNGMPEKVKNRILQRADGNPFFIEEVMRSFIDIGAVVRKNGCYLITDMVGAVTIPQTVNDVVMSRIDRLDDSTREVLRIASVIGRTFFHRILSHVIDDTEKIESALRELKEMQLIIERYRFDETEYVFKHALAQETAYASMLNQKRRELHGKIASAIEIIFKDRLNEFYGMLAYHYIGSDDTDRAETCMLKAGEESLRAGASNEAFYYYQEALAIYLKKYGDSVDFLKVAKIEKNIAQSLYNRGQYKEALSFYKKALACYNIQTPEKGIFLIICFLFAFLDFLVSLYLPSLKWRKDPEARDIEVINLFYNKVSTLLYTDSKKFFMESFFFSRYLSRYNIKKIKGGVGMFAGLSVAFSWSAVSFRLSRRIFSFGKQKVHPEDRKSRLNLEMANLFLGYYTGNWDISYDKDLIEFGLQQGSIMHVSGYIAFLGRIRLEQGRYREVRNLVKQLSDISSTYSHDFSQTLKYFLNTKLLLKYRKLRAAMIEAEEGIAFVSRTDFKQVLMVLYSFKVLIYLFLDDILNAKKFLDAANKIRSETDIVSSYLCHYLMSLAHFKLYCLEAVLEKGDRKTIKICREKAFEACRLIKKSSRKVVSYQAEAYRLMGKYYLLTGCHRKALKLWDQSLSIGVKLGAQIEVSRTCFEIGCFWNANREKLPLAEKDNGNAYLERAKNQFQSMELYWDLEKIQKIHSSRG